MWTSFELGGVTYDLGHLAFRTFEWEIELKNKQKKAIKVDVRFSCHCFSRKPKQKEVFDAAQVVMDHKGVRLFDTLRYELSLGLPALIADLPSQKVFHTGYHNLVRVSLIDKYGEATKYYVFLALSRDGKRVKMVVESAYPDDLVEDKPKYDKPIRFLVALRNVYERR